MEMVKMMRSMRKRALEDSIHSSPRSMNDFPAVLFAGAFMMGDLHLQVTENAVVAGFSPHLITDNSDNFKLVICKCGYHKEFY